MKRSDELMGHRKAVVAFTDAYTALMNLMEREPHGFTEVMDVYRPKPRRQKEAARAYEEVSRLAGAAAVGANESGATMVVYGGVVPVQSVHPITNWPSSLKEAQALRPDHVVSYCHQVVGVLDTMIAKARRDERSLAGIVARFIRFPSEVRRLAGGSRAKDRAAFGLGVIVQGVIIAVVGGVLTAVILAILKLT